MTTKESQLQAVYHIEDDLKKEIAELEETGKTLEAKRLRERVTYDMEMVRELGHCSGIENYSRYFDGRAAGTRPDKTALGRLSSSVRSLPLWKIKLTLLDLLMSRPLL